MSEVLKTYTGVAPMGSFAVLTWYRIYRHVYGSLPGVLPVHRDQLRPTSYASNAYYEAIDRVSRGEKP